MNKVWTYCEVNSVQNRGECPFIFYYDLVCQRINLEFSI